MLHKLDHRTIRNLKSKDRDYTVSDGGNLYIHVRRYGRKEWLFRYTSPVTKKRRNSGFGSFPDISLKEARAMAADKRALLDRKLDPIIEDEKQLRAEKILHSESKALERNTVEAVFFEWKQAELKNRKDGGKEIERAFEKDVFKVIGQKPISDVVRDDVKDILQRPLKRGANRMANRMLSDLKQFFGYAVDEEYMDKDPTSRMKKSRVGGVETPRDRFIKENERGVLVKLLPASGLSERYQNAIWIMLTTGCRVQELSKARWKNIDFNKRIFKIPSLDAKNKKKHEVYLSDLALRSFRLLYNNRISETWVFPSRDGKTHTNRRTISKQVTNRQLFKPIKGRPKEHDTLVLPNGCWTVHDLRRTVATIMQELGVFPHIVQKCLNQTVNDPIIQTYQRADLFEKQKEAFEMLGKYWESVIDLTRVD